MAPAVADAIAASLSAIARELPAPVPPLGYGSDIMSLDDLDPRARDIDPNSVDGIKQALYHRFSTPRGLIRDAEDFGMDLVGMLNSPIAARDNRLKEGAIEAEAKKDDRVSAVQVSAKEVSHGNWRFTFVVTPVDPSLGTFPLVLSVSNGQVLIDATASNRG